MVLVVRAILHGIWMVHILNYEYSMLQVKVLPQYKHDATNDILEDQLTLPMGATQS